MMVDGEREPVLPERMRGLPRDKHGRPVPWFVAWFDGDTEMPTGKGEPDFRVIRRGGIHDAQRFKLCWVCGKPRGSFAAFVIGPMCAVNHTTAEPPAHRDCAVYSARACPFLTTPNMTRRERHLPADMTDPAGIMITRNPGVALVWVSRRWGVFSDPNGQPLFDIGDPDQVYWFAHGRDATRAEVLASIESGLPILRSAAEPGGAAELRKLEGQVAGALELLPVS